MNSPTKEGSDQAEKAVENCENEASNDYNEDVEPSVADPNMISQESSPVNRELNTSVSREDAVSPIVENSELEPEKTQQDPQKEDVTENSLLIQIPIPRKLIFLVSGLEKITFLTIPVLKIVKNSSSSERSKFDPGNMKIKTNDLSDSTVNQKSPPQLTVSWRIPFLSDQEIRRMILRLLCGRHFSQATGRQNPNWAKQKYIAISPRPNILIRGERPTLLGRPLRVNYYRPLIERMTLGNFYKSMDTKEKDESPTFVRPVFYIPRAQIQNEFNRKAFENHLRSHHNMRVVVISTSNGWKYLCPICGGCFNNFNEFRQHSCSF